MSDFNIYEELMPKIQALISPPDNGSTGSSKEKSSSNLIPYFKKRSKRHNHDYCDACGGRGKILCCDICPASFHLLCHDPPLSEKEIKNGHWICHACQYSRRTEQETQANTTNGNPSTNEKDISETNSNHSQTSSTEKVTSEIMEINIPEVNIKDETIEEEKEETLVNEVEETGFVIGVTKIKEECNDDVEINENLVFPLKSESEMFECHDSADENDSEMINVNMDDVWKIIGVDKQVKINTDKEENLNAVSRNSSDVESSLNGDNVRREIQISIPNCDYLLKNRKYSCTSNESVEKVTRKPVTKKTRGSRCRSKAKRQDHANGIKKIFEVVIGDTCKANPKQFALPSEYIAHIDLNLIRTEKDPDSFPNDLDSGDLLKLPARKCYYCKGTCLTGQIISCDFCPAHFHLNCLNPPLCSIPDVKWMCPLHPHHVLDRVMKNPSSITELMSWWSKFSSPIDDEDVKSNFINKVKSSEKRPLNGEFIRSSVQIPDIVKYHYKYPPVRIPSLRELMHSESGCVFEDNFTLTRHDVIERSNNCCGIEDNRQKTINYTSAINAQNQNWKDLVEIACEAKNSDEKNEHQSDGQIFDNFKILGQNYNTDTSWKSMENFIIRDINRNFITGGINITTLSEDLRRLLLVEKIKQYTQDLPPSFIPNTNPYPLFHPLLKQNIKDTLPNKPKGSVRAVLCPLSHRPLVYMYGQSLSVGSGFSNDICLLHYGNCNFISDEHAVIFYDKVTNTYELINYSEYNTVVDGVCYTCDISRDNTINEVVEKPPAKNLVPHTLKRKIALPEPKKRTASAITAAETRNIHKKLLQDIDELVHKSQEEMASIAEEDLNEISKAINNTSIDNRVGHKEQNDKKIRSRKTSKKPIRKASDQTVKKPELSKTANNPINGQRPSISLSKTILEKRLTARTRKRRNPVRTRKSKIKRARVSGDEHTEDYLLSDNFFINPKRDKCRCHLEKVKFPNGRDSSWEKTATLNHGSYIRFGCMEFIFSIVNYPAPTDQRVYNMKRLASSVQLVEPVRSEEPKNFIPAQKDDLSLKLISILNVLSSKNSSLPSSSNVSSASSSFSSRSDSPVLENGDGKDRFEINYSDSDSRKDHLNDDHSKEGQIEITG